MNYMLLIKLMYLAERSSLLTRGRTITGDDFYALKDGPVLSRTLNLIREGTPERTGWAEYVSEKEPDFTVALRSDNVGDLSESEIRILDEVFDQYGHWNQFTLRDHLHKILPEWSHPGRTSFLIDPESILRFEHKSDKDIERVAAKAHEDRFFDQL